MQDGPSIDDYWRQFVVQAKVAYNDAVRRSTPFGVVVPPSNNLTADSVFAALDKIAKEYAK